ncbi:uncharacterized protein BDZ99DRAFT_260016 [Mytilinidion resinicola]|uniref:Peptidase A1 domain-containing protein n=1 Tax=Mytilinidion resinicola TaxID=574789 RepID=A0A6A6YVV0_9PEZI|nr:uncharacterized protein BDZ99DRAFT_260016 [Mytilinidion resinicola]KAF2812037.1 hypothetical protein BDZ99DRAFT_260016 [Mytilinidion resinicola]
MIFGASSVMARSGIGQSYFIEGILALGPRYDANSTHPTVWAKLATALPQPVFVTDLRFNGRGEYTFGTIPYHNMDVSFWDGDINEQDLWRLPITSYAIGGHATEKKIAKACFDAIVDTGCSFLRLPPCIVQSYYAMVPGHIQRDGVYLFLSR